MKLYAVIGYDFNESGGPTFIYGIFSREEKALEIKANLEKAKYENEEEEYEIEEYTLNEPSESYYFMINN